MVIYDTVAFNAIVLHTPIFCTVVFYAVVFSAIVFYTVVFDAVVFYTVVLGTTVKIRHDVVTMRVSEEDRRTYRSFNALPSSQCTEAAEGD